MADERAQLPELHEQVKAVADALGAALEALDLSKTVIASALITVLMNFFTNELESGNPHLATEMRLTARRMLALADATPDTVDAVAKSISDAAGRRH